MKGQGLILRYAAFAAVATLANLATQRLILLAGNSAGQLALAIATGTVVGLLVKYLLDKRWIFYDSAIGMAAHWHRFPLYAGTGLGTTAFFWGMEAAFWLVWQTEGMRELGAVLGLAVGYVIKYTLDRRFVFTAVRAQARA